MAILQAISYRFFFPQVVHSSGKAGHNVEYVLKIAQWMRHTLPSVEDDHLYSLEYHIRRLVRRKGLVMSELMGVPVEMPGECPRGGIYCCKRIDRVRCCSGSASDDDEASGSSMSDVSATAVPSSEESDDEKKVHQCLRCVHF